MEERWWPLVWLLGSILGYGLFMRHHPLRDIFASAFAFARNNLSIVSGLAALLVATVAWRFSQETGLSSENSLALSLSSWGDLLAWVPHANDDLRAIFWYCVPLDVAFLVGTPLASLTCWYWIPRLWKACLGVQKPWLAGIVFGLFVLSLWWWAQRCSEVLKLGIQVVPNLTGLRHLLRGLGELGFAVLIVAFVQMVLLLGGYRSHGSGTSRCHLREALDWGLKCFPRIVPIPLTLLAAISINWLAEDRLDLKAAPVWDVLKFLALILTAASPICVLLLQDLNPWEALKASFRFLLRTSWRYLWFLFLCLSHFFLLRLLESYLLASVLTGEAVVLVWYVIAALLKAALVIWFVNALCLYFCIDVTQRQDTKDTSEKPMMLTTLQARIRSRRRRPIALPDMTDLDAQSQHAAEITKKSRSNFALAFATLSKDRREAMVTYYAFCRVVDDIVDEPGPTRDERLRLLDRWRHTVDGKVTDLSSFERDVSDLQATYEIPAREMHLLIDGMEKDLDTKRYDTFEELLGYCYHVASAVGFVCMRIFGCDVAKTQPYAENLGYCLQLTNIIRDVVEDWTKDQRIYIPREDLDRFELDESLFDKGPEGTRFLEMMEFQHERAVSYYDKTAQAIPKSEKRRVIATETMRDTYRAILEKMHADQFRVFEKRYRLGRLHKVGILTRRMLASLVTR